LLWIPNIISNSMLFILTPYVPQLLRTSELLASYYAGPAANASRATTGTMKTDDASASFASSSSALQVSSADGKVRVTVDHASALITSVTLLGGPPIVVSSGWAVEGTVHVASSVVATSVEGKLGLKLRQVSCLVEDMKLNRSCTPLQVAITTTLLSEADTVNVTAEIEGLSAEPQSATVPWTGLVTLGFTFSDAGSLQIWAPWNREGSLHGADAGVLGPEDHDGLLPSFGGYSWPTVEMTFGNLAEYDFPGRPSGEFQGYGVAAEHVTVLSPHADNPAGFSLIGDPANAPLTLGTLALQGPRNGGARCTSPAQCHGEAAFSMNFYSLKLQPGVVHRRQYSLFPHSACIRPGLGKSLAAFPDFWNPVNTAFREQEGLGSFSEYPGFQIKSATQDNRYLTPQQMEQMQQIGYRVAWVPDFGPLRDLRCHPQNRGPGIPRMGTSPTHG